MRRFVSTLLMTLLAFLGTFALHGAAQAATEKRVALVIGNSAYTIAPALSNPVIDAKAVAASLKRLGFEVIEGYDLNFSGMRGKLGEFSTALADARAGLVYYAGHGVAVDEENYLLPTDIALKSVADLELNALNLSLILRQMKREERVNVVILDACRDNPFARELATGRGRSVVAERGLSRIDSELAKGTLIAFATDPKATALDGRAGENSPFTKSLLRHIETPNVSIDTVMNRVRADVWDQTKNKQMPWVNTSIIGEFILNPGAQVAALQPAAQPVTAISGSPAPAAPPFAVAPDRVTMENRFWESAERGNSVDDYRAYLDAYPNGIYAAMAKARVARLDTRAPQAQTPAATPAPAAAAAAPAAEAPVVSTIDVAALKAEAGTMQTEQALKLDAAARKEIQARLNVLQFAAGAENGTFAEKTRKAIAEWQKSRDLATTGWLGKLQLAALKEQSESPFQRAKEAQRMAPAPTAVGTRNLGKQKAARQAPAAVSPGVREAQRERAYIRAQQRASGPRQGYGGGPAPSSGAGAAFGSFLGGVAAGALIGGAFRR